MARIVQGQKHRAGKKGSRAYGRNKVKCARYRQRGIRELHKAAKLARRAKWLAKRGGKNGIHEQDGEGARENV